MDKILFVDDEINILNSIKRIFHREAYQIITANSGNLALDLLKENPDIAVVVSDFRMPYMSGSELLEQVSTLYPHTTRMILSGYADKENIIETINKGHIYKFLVKPWDDTVLKDEVKQALALFQNNDKNQGLTLVVDTMANGALVTDVHFRLLKINLYIKNLVENEIQLGTQENIFEEHGLLLPQSLQNSIIKNFDEFDTWSGEGYIRVNSSKLLPVSIHVKKFFETFKKEPYYIFNIIDISKQKEIEREIQYRYHHDQSTGLLNKRALIDNLTIHIKDFYEQNYNILNIQFYRLSEIYDSLDNIKRIVLTKYIIDNIQAACQQYINNNIYYIGNGEFTVSIINGETSEIERIASDLCHVFTLPFVIDESKIPLNVNIAISRYPLDGTTIADILKNAQYTLNYLATKGINAYAFHQDCHKVKSYPALKEQLSFESELYEALSKEQFNIYYQPFIDFKTNKIFGCEALIRWKHPKLGIVAPDQFIPLLEKTGLIFPVTTWLIERIFIQLKEWQAAGFDQIKIAVNLSANQFHQPDFCEGLLKFIKKYDVSPSCIELEITESTLMENIATNKIVLEKLRDLGFNLSLDDFGTGYSSFSVLKKLPFNILKIDRSFVQDAPQYKNSESILSSIIAMGQSLGMHVIAEGVETDEQIKLLKNYNCDYGQGYYYSKPVPADEFQKLLQNPKVHKPGFVNI